MGDGTAGEIYRLSAGSFGADDLQIVSFRGVEGLSRLFVFDISVSTTLGSADVEGLIEQPASFEIDGLTGTTRVVQGIVGAVRVHKPSAVDGRRVCQIRFVPKLWLLRHRRQSRIFQYRTVQEIVTTLCDEATIATRWSLATVLPIPPYCVQYDETDYQFIRRILAERGIFFTFEPSEDTAGTTTVVFSDTAQGYSTVAGNAVVSFRDSERDAPDEHINDLVLDRDIRPKIAFVRDWDFVRPNLDLAAIASVQNDGSTSERIVATASALREYAAPEDGEQTDGEQTEGAAAEAPSPPASGASTPSEPPPETAPQQLEVYSHRGEFHDYDVSSYEPRMQLEQLRRRQRVGHGGGTCRHFVPGARFTLEGHPAEGFDGEYVLVKVEHEGVVPELARKKDAKVYVNRFEVVPANIPYRPARSRRRLQHVVESARVVGPEGEDVYTDEHGRIKVQFHWDREGQKDEHSSVWMRVMQPWSGSNWGHQFIPRIGMEVLVAFMCGDPDRPVVIGSLPNAEQPPPFKLPTHKTRSGIRTRSTPDGDGYNELSFDDARGGEEVHLRAQRDLSVETGNNHTSVVDRNRTALVRGSLEETVLGDRRERVGQNYGLHVDGNAHAHTTGDAVTFAGGFRDDVVEGEYTLRVDQSQTVMIGYDPEQHRSNTFVVGDWSLGSDGAIHIKAAGGLVLECGENKISITKDEVKIEAATLTMKASKSVSVKGNGPAITLSDEAELAAKKLTVVTEETTMQLDKVVDIRAPTVKLNCKPDPTKPPDPASPPPKTSKLSVRLTDASFTPYAKKKYHLFAGTDRFDGETDADGVVSQDLPDGTKRADITLWLEEFPTGPRLYWKIHIVDQIPAITEVKGVQQRLKNLGYYEGDCDGELDDEVRAAVRWLQLDAGLDQTGEPDAAFQGKLAELHND